MTIKKPGWKASLKALDPCHEAYVWAIAQKDPQSGWDICEEVEWMIWLIDKTRASLTEETERKMLVLCACDIARLALQYVTKSEPRPLQAIEAAESWARGEGASIEDVRVAAAAYTATAANDVAYAAISAANANVAYAAISALAYTDAATFAATFANAGDEMKRKCADIVRKHYPIVPEVTK